MAANGYFPSIYDRAESQETWSFHRPNPTRSRILQTISRRESGSGTSFVGPSHPAARRAEPPAVCKTPNLLKVPERRPLGVFSATGSGGGSAPLSEADEICELCIKLKEFELCEMMEDESKTPLSKFPRTFRMGRPKPRKQRIEKKQQ